MKKHLLHLIIIAGFAATTAFGHSSAELGPNGGRILEFSKNETMHGEVTVKDGKFHIAVLDKEMKPVALEALELTATSGDRAKPEKLAVEKIGGKFVVPTVKDGEWIIFQFRETAKAKPITARLHYDTKKCATCNEQEWLCKCEASVEKKK